MEHRSVLRALGGPRACRGQRGEKGRGGPAFFRVYSYIYIGIIFTYIYISIYIYIMFLLFFLVGFSLLFFRLALFCVFVLLSFRLVFRSCVFCFLLREPWDEPLQTSKNYSPQ